jgi:hypothetical protein
MLVKFISLIPGTPVQQALCVYKAGHVQFRNSNQSPAIVAVDDLQVGFDDRPFVKYRPD